MKIKAKLHGNAGLVDRVLRRTVAAGAALGEVAVVQLLAPIHHFSRQESFFEAGIFDFPSKNPHFFHSEESLSVCKTDEVPGLAAVDRRYEGWLSAFLEFKIHHVW